MRLTSVAADGFKNLKAVQFSPSPHYNLIIGENAQGKTNLLEAVAQNLPLPQSFG